METYQEKVLRYRIYRQTTSKAHIEAGAGFGLYYSTNDYSDAVRVLTQELQDDLNYNSPLYNYKIVDGYEQETIERPVY